MKLTYELLHSAGTSGCGFNTAQLVLLGVSVPPKKGWLTHLIGKKIPDEVWAEVMKYKSQRLPKTVRRNFRQGKIPFIAKQFDFQI